MHKKPFIKFRAIVSSVNSLTKPLEKTVCHILKQIYIKNRNYCQILKTYDGINRMWICTNYLEILSDIDHINRKYCAKSFEVFDFSTLYTKFEHDSLKDNLKWCMERAFNKKNLRISVYKTGASWVVSPRDTSYSYNIDECILLNETLIDNAYFKVGNFVFKQKIGVAMGSDPAPFQANLGLYFYEFQFQNKYKNRMIAYKLNHTQRYIDDVNCKNDNGTFQQQMQQIYPSELELTKENQGTSSGSVLEIELSIKNKKFETKIYDKRDEFSFNIIKYPSADSNIHDTTIHGVFVSQLVRYLRVSSKLSFFIDRASRLFYDIHSKGIPNKSLQGLFIKFLRKNEEVKKFNQSNDNICKLLVHKVKQLS